MMTNFQAFADGLVLVESKNTTTRLSIQTGQDLPSLENPQDRHMHLRFFDSRTNNLIPNVAFTMNVTKGNQIFLYRTFYTQSGDFTLNLKSGDRYLWDANPDHDPMDGLYYSKGDQIDIVTPYFTRDLYHFEIRPLAYVVGGLVGKELGIKYETALNLLDTYNKTITPEIIQDNQLPSVIITQVELDSPFVFLPDNQTCSSQYGLDSQHSCLTDLVPDRKVQCGYFLGSKTCEPIHLNYHFVNSCTIAYGFYANGTAMKDVSHEFGEQWVNLYNRLDRPITVSHFEIFPYKDWEATYGGPKLPYHVANQPSISPYLVLGPHQSCTYGFYAIDEPMSLNTKNTTLTAVYQYNGTQYQSQTPQLTDNYNDSKTWQFDGNTWAFAEQNTVTVPEFPFAIPVLLASFVSVIVFYRMRFEK